MKNDFSAYASLLSATPADAEGTASWLADREVAREAMKMEVEETVQDNERLTDGSNGFDDQIAISQIRILSKFYTMEPDVIPYVAVIGKWDDDMWLIVPFSPYKTPATPGEMATGLDAYGLHVLQVWNGRTIQEAILKKSYLFGVLPENVRLNALSLFRHVLFGTLLASDFSAKRGSPIVEEADPRRDYLNECIARLQPLADAVIAETEKENRLGRNGGILEAPNEFFKSVFSRSEVLPEYGLAAATTDNQKTSLLLLEGKDNSVESFVEACVECRLLRPFISIGRARKPYNLAFEVDIPEQWAHTGEIEVLARNRADGELIGYGKLDTETGRGVIRTRSTNADINKASQMVLVVVKN